MTRPIDTPPHPKLPADFGTRLRKARQQRGWTQTEVALATGVRRETIARLETSRRTPGAHLLDALLRPDVLGNEISVIEGWEEHDDPYSLSRGYLCYLARKATGRSLKEVAAAVSISPASLSLFERTAAVPVAIVGRGASNALSVARNAYAQVCGFASAAAMTKYLRSNNPAVQLREIARAHNRPERLGETHLPYPRRPD